MFNEECGAPRRHGLWEYSRLDVMDDCLRQDVEVEGSPTWPIGESWSAQTGAYISKERGDAMGGFGNSIACQGRPRAQGEK